MNTDNINELKLTVPVKENESVNFESEKQSPQHEWVPSFEMVVNGVPGWKHPIRHKNTFPQPSEAVSQGALLSNKQTGPRRTKVEWKITQTPESPSGDRLYTVQRVGYLSAFNYSITATDLLPINKNFTL